MMQQLDEVFDNMAAAMLAKEDLSEDDVRLLRLWKVYDEQFLVATRKDEAGRYARATVLFRLGLTNHTLQDHSKALLDFRRAAVLLRELSDESPGVTSYAGEEFYCWINAAESALKLNDRTLAARCEEAAAQILKKPGMKNSANFDDLIQTHQKIAMRIRDVAVD